MSQEVEIARKSSLLSILSSGHEKNRKSSSPKENEKVPEDRFFLVHICCFFLGFMNVMPITFFSTAAGYWMYKFRDPTIQSDSTTGSDRTTLQSYFQSSSMAANSLPTIIFCTIYTLYGHKFSAILRLVWSLALMIIIFITFTLFTQIDTDSWQIGFFIMTVCLALMNSALVTTLQMSTPIILVKLPHEYMFYFLLGQNGTFITTTLQYIALASTNHQSTSGLIYFICGTIIIAVTLLLVIASRMSHIFKFYDVEDLKEEKPETIIWAEAKEIIKKIWPCQLVAAIVYFNLTSIHPSVTTLIVSQYEADNTGWAKKYFVPTTAYMVPEIASLLGRVIGRNARLTESSQLWYIGFTLLRLIISVPFFLLCHAEPRNLPVIFNKDWEVIVFQIIYGLTVGYLMNVSFMSLKSLAGEKQEVGLKLLTLSTVLVGSTSSVFGILSVKILYL